jgi:hypothetical protein
VAAARVSWRAARQLLYSTQRGGRSRSDGRQAEGRSWCGRAVGVFDFPRERRGGGCNKWVVNKIRAEKRERRGCGIVAAGSGQSRGRARSCSEARSNSDTRTPGSVLIRIDQRQLCAAECRLVVSSVAACPASYIVLPAADRPGQRYSVRLSALVDLQTHPLKGIFPPSHPKFPVQFQFFCTRQPL